MTNEQGKKIAKGLQAAIVANKQKNVENKKLDKNGNLIKGCFVASTKVLPWIKENFAATQEEAISCINRLSETTGLYKVGKCRKGGILYLPEDYKEYGKTEKQSEGFEQFMK